MVSWRPLLLLPLLSTLAAGAARADDVDVELVSKVLKGNRQPAVVLKVNKAIRSATLKLRGSGGEAVEVVRQGIKRGRVESLTFDAPLGQTTFEGTLSILFEDGSGGDMPLKFQVDVVGGLEIEAPPARLDLDEGRMQVRVSRPAARCDYQLFVRGRRPISGTVDFAAPLPWTWLTLRWKKPAQKVLKVRVVCFDTDGFSRGLDMTPTDPPKLRVPEDRLDIVNGRLEVEVSRVPSACDIDLTFDGAPRQRRRTTWKKPAADTLLPVTWKPPGGGAVLLRIALTCSDASDSAATLEIYPWELDVPHEEVHFDSGRWDILAAESPKIDAALAPMQTAIQRYGKVIAITLYVIGYTDTVGSRDGNRTLSLNRARAIAEYLRAHGISVPIRYTGFGEDVLAVPTNDETDEVRNRRARYILAVEPPERASWSKL